MAQRKRTPSQRPRRLSHQTAKAWVKNDRAFSYGLDFSAENFRSRPELYRVGRGEEGVLMVEPYKSEILPFWKFAQPELAKESAHRISELFKLYKASEDFVGMDMARKYLQMGYTRSRRYANHRSGRKYAENHELLPFENDAVKAKSAEIFWSAWQKAESDLVYADLKHHWKCAFG